ncbi:aminotransferase class V-fold PLP-dependent enzyme [Roseomonas sp. CECT 9278]|uniref:aminotransferase class V-fold PLP-dependent enzyme n=1 Tax=Roseomonas sp. CECT 9278 TaxID=2845823 RepID=UPI001E432F41|nr:aminotransferase class V-fold PLP-dependent enzyme [Roseomonas sp. CECT 9278]CAH0254346.1 D-glucosaminate-6-phosphate ammonia lyase [Roseomonas sp. CECT 9278]
MKRIINAYGTNTRLSGGMMAPEVIAAMAEAARSCFEMPDVQAAASRAIVDATGAEAGIVTAGAAAALMLGAAACIARLDPAAMNRLPDTDGLPDEFIVSRSQRNMYDRALRVAGGRIIEVGIPDRLSGPGVRDASAGEIADAITPRTAAVFHLAGEHAEPPLPDLVRVAHARGIPVLVDAAAQLPPASNLRRFIADGADLVCFSGGKAIGGPQASGILCGRADLVSSALAQMLDLDLPEAQFVAPPEFAPLNQLRFLPHHGIGRVAKVGKEEVAGLVAALRRFVAEVPTARWMARLGALDVPGAVLVPDGAKPGLPLLELRFADRAAAERADAALRARDPAVHVDASRIRRGVLAVNPIALDDADLAELAAALTACCGAAARR